MGIDCQQIEATMSRSRGIVTQINDGEAVKKVVTDATLRQLEESQAALLKMMDQVRGAHFALQGAVNGLTAVEHPAKLPEYSTTLDLILATDDGGCQAAHTVIVYATAP